MFSAEVSSTSGGLAVCLKRRNFLLSFCKVFGVEGPQNAKEVRPYLRLTWGQLKIFRQTSLSQIGVILSKLSFRTQKPVLSTTALHRNEAPCRHRFMNIAREATCWIGFKNCGVSKPYYVQNLLMIVCLLQRWHSWESWPAPELKLCQRWEPILAFFFSSKP